MPYVLGIHLGATATSAAVVRRDENQAVPASPFPLGSAAPAVPTMLCKVQDGSFVAGEVAQRQEPAHHEWVVRSFTRQVGDDCPLLVGSEFVTAHRLAAVMIEWVADQVAHRQGAPPDHIAVAHHAAWGPHRTHLVYRELAQLGLNEVTLLPESVAVGLDYASRTRVEENDTIAVANIGGSGCDATVLRKSQDGELPGFEVLGSPLDSEHPSGQALDDEVLGYLRKELGESSPALDPADPRDRVAAFQLRAECIRGREALSHQPGIALRVELPQVRTQVALSRAKYEQLARNHLEYVPDLLQQAVQSAPIGSTEPGALVLAGGTARTPLVQQLVSRRFEQQAQVDGAPELVAARGAACAARTVLLPGRSRPVAAEETSLLMRVEHDPESLPIVEEESEAPERPEVPRPPVEIEPLSLEPPETNRTFKIIKLVLAAALIIFGLVLTYMQGWGGPQQPSLGILSR
ncbi:Hsp70 protein [Halopolyspora algeriensis]|uniref:Hsp70 protein n=1 Tax=Halopolyspora algeriensis TaxID=1500506 RepID=A0A368VIR5_9ACTN|nr:Hsp70 family protein [Halopolyspora algeriensis]RCW40259.1 Hsp70 protein [Halopolyspora algeriensis]TQM46260.1 Hsp70 protein [Halopolyspora algeriensis]